MAITKSNPTPTAAELCTERMMKRRAARARIEMQNMRKSFILDTRPRAAATRRSARSSSPSRVFQTSSFRFGAVSDDESTSVVATLSIPVLE